MQILHNIGAIIQAQVCEILILQIVCSQIIIVFVQISTVFTHTNMPSRLSAKVNFEELGFSIMHPEKLSPKKCDYGYRQFKG